MTHNRVYSPMSKNDLLKWISHSYLDSASGFKVNHFQYIVVGGCLAEVPVLGSLHPYQSLTSSALHWTISTVCDVFCVRMPNGSTVLELYKSLVCTQCCPLMER